MASDTTIAGVRARQILDSRGRPTVEADVYLASGAWGRASVPSGASTGAHEAVELRDGDPNHYAGLGVRRAVGNVQQVLAKAVRGLDAANQRALDGRLLEADGTPNKSRLGANALLAVSLAACRAAAAGRDLPLYRHIADLAGVPRATLPLPMVNIISGGLHAGQQIDLQDFLVVPLRARSFSEALADAAAVHRTVGELVKKAGEPQLVADEGGWGPRLASNEAALEWLVAALEIAGLRPGVDAAIAVDVAATHFFDPQRQGYELHSEGRALSSHEMADLLATWVERYPIVSLEDGLAEDDWQGWRELTARLGGRVQLLGDDLFTTNPQRLQRGLREGTANAILVKANQIGTLSETLAVVSQAQTAGYRTVISARSGETEDSFLADLAVGCAGGQIKVGSVTRSSRLAKWNQLLRLEEELGSAAYLGAAALGR
ncbi:MAG: phosphopyruvate hydratase [Chloroflexi bacterium]|nr:phosphopyruvate hydratase [Chloroflexota bacterium]